MQRQLWNLLIDQLKWDGRGKALDIGTGGGPVAILLARKDPESLVKCIDYWGCLGRIRGRNVNGTRSRGLEIGLVGVMLLWYDYNMLGVALGGAGIVAALLFQLLARDPTVY